jgi:hypothetical protein
MGALDCVLVRDLDLDALEHSEEGLERCLSSAPVDWQGRGDKDVEARERDQKHD